METTSHTELRQSLGRVRSLLAQQPEPASAQPATRLLEAVTECVRLLERGQHELEAARTKQQALAAELANLQTRLAVLEHSRLFRLLRLFGLERRPAAD